MPPVETNRPVILVLGPTAGGKTSLSIALARSLPGSGECISADSMLVYRGMDIGTAKPTLDERGGIPHHLIDVVDPDTPWTIDQWVTAAEEAVGDIRTRGRWPIVVGGTNLYVQAFLAGMMPGAPPDPDLRRELEAQDPGELRQRLEELDPDAADRIHANDLRRTIRALEVAVSTGHPISRQQTQWTAPIRQDVIIIALKWKTEAINRRINARVAAMMDQGLLEEVRGLHEQGRLGPQAREAVGYAQMIDHLQGSVDLETAVEQIKIRTRRLGKGQRTWFRRFQAIEGICWLEADFLDPQDLVQQALEAIVDHCRQ